MFPLTTGHVYPLMKPTSENTSVTGRYIALWLLACLTLFVIAMTVAMAGYPGGHSWSSGAMRYDFWRNFWCDLFLPVSRGAKHANGFSRQFALFGMVAITAGAAPLWFGFGRLIPGSPRLARVIRSTGLLSVAGILPVALTAGHALLHPLSILVTALSAWLAALLAVIALDRQYPGRTVSRLGWAMLLLGAVNFLLYVREVYLGGSPWLALPATQKLATLAMLLWLVKVAWLFLRQEPAYTK